MIIDAKDTILGRLASYVAKQALLGEKIDVLNCEYLIITGTKKRIIEDYKKKRKAGEPFHGPFFPKAEDKLVRRAIRGMIPYRTKKGLTAFKNIKCYKGIPEEFLNKEYIKLPFNISKLKVLKYITIKDLCKEI